MRSNSFEFDDDGVRAPGAKVYFYNAGTSTPRTTYSDAALATANTHPVVADGNGRWPQVFLQFGDYKELATTSGGTELWETDNIPNPAPTDPGVGVDANAIFQTGDMIFVGKNGTRTGFVRCNGRTIGSAASAATERANADAAAAFAFVWDNYANGQCAVSTGRGASAAADFAANKTIALPDYRGACLTGFDDMGNTAASLYGSAPVVTGSGILAGSVLGANTHVITEAQLAAHVHAINITSTGVSALHSHTFAATSSSNGDHSHTINISDPGHVHTQGYIEAFETVSPGGGPTLGANDTSADNTGSNTTGITASSVSTGAHDHTVSGTTSTDSPNHTHTVQGDSASKGSGTAHNIMARSAPVTVLMKL